MKKALQKITGKTDIDKDLVLLLSIGGLFALSIALSNTFVNVFLWRQSGEFRDIALYNLAVFILQPVTFIVAGRMAKRIDRVLVLRLGVIFLSLFYLVVLTISEQASSYIILLGSVLGVGLGFYWLAYNVLTFEITEPETRDFFNGFAGLLNSFGGMIGPIAAGVIISRYTEFQGYTVIFSISLALFLGAVVLSMRLKRRSADGEYCLNEVVKERRKNKNWKLLLYAHFSQGIREGSFMFMITMWVFITTKSELALGTFGLINSGVSLIFYYLATRVIKPEQRKSSILISGTVLYAAVFLLLFQLTFAKLIIYGVIIAMAYPFLFVPYTSITFDVIGQARRAAEMRVEYIVIREQYLNGGRIVSILLFLLLLTMFGSDIGIPILMAVVGAGHFIIYFFIRNIHFGEERRETNSQKGLHTAFYRNNKLIDGEGGSTG